MKYYKDKGYDKAIIGVDDKNRIVYDKHKMIEILLEQGWDDDEAIEHLEYNVWCAYVGEHTPIYVDLMDIDKIELL